MNLFKEIHINNLPLIIFQLTLFTLLQSCSGSQFGKRLTNSFDAPSELDVNSEKIIENNKEEKLIKDKNNKLLKKDITILEKNIDKSSLLKSNRKSLSRESRFVKLKPYRIIIRLYGEDPSSPAQIVTSVLRNAGVDFEVEKIEKFDINEKVKSSSVR